MRDPLTAAPSEAIRQSCSRRIPAQPAPPAARSRVSIAQVPTIEKTVRPSRIDARSPDMKLTRLWIAFTILGALAATDFAQGPSVTVSTSGLRAASAYLDKRLDWWVHWP